MDNTELVQKLEKSFDAFANFRTEHEEALKRNNTETAETKAKLEAMSQEFATLTEEHQKAKQELEQIKAMQNASVENQEPDTKAMRRKQQSLLHRFIKDAPRGADLTEYVKTNKDALDLEYKGLSIVNPSEGGYLVFPDQMGMERTQEYETSDIRKVARIRRTSNAYVEFNPLTGKTTATKVSELGTRSETGTPSIGMQRINTVEYMAETHVSHQMLEDTAEDVDSFIQSEAQYAFDLAENTDFVIGTEAPRGFCSYPNWATPGTFQVNAIERLPSLDASTITYTGIKRAQYSILSQYQNNASWLMHRTTFGKINELQDGNGRYLVDPDLNRNAGIPFSIQGQPVLLAADMAEIADGAGALVIAYGDFKRAFMIVDRLGIKLLKDPYTSDTGEIKFKMWKRVGSAVINFQALKLIAIAAA